MLVSEDNMQKSSELEYTKALVSSEQEKVKFMAEELSVLKPIIYEKLDTLKTSSSGYNTHFLDMKRFGCF